MDSIGNRPETTGYCGFVVGQHVVCIGAPEDTSHLPVVVLDKPKAPVVNKVYTVRSVELSEVGEKRVCLTLCEIPDQFVRIIYKGEVWMSHVLFAAQFFRPLQKLTPEQFMQTDVPVKGREVAA